MSSKNKGTSDDSKKRAQRNRGRASEWLDPSASGFKHRVPMPLLKSEILCLLSDAVDYLRGADLFAVGTLGQLKLAFADERLPLSNEIDLMVVEAAKILVNTQMPLAERGLPSYRKIKQ